MTAGTRNLVLGLIIIFLILGAMAALVMVGQRNNPPAPDSASEQTFDTAPDTTPVQTSPADSASESTPSTLPTIR